jgi:hypothetical protein
VIGTGLGFAVYPCVGYSVAHAWGLVSMFQYIIGIAMANVGMPCTRIYEPLSRTTGFSFSYNCGYGEGPARRRGSRAANCGAAGAPAASSQWVLGGPHLDDRRAPWTDSSAAWLGTIAGAPLNTKRQPAITNPPSVCPSTMHQTLRYHWRPVAAGRRCHQGQPARPRLHLCPCDLASLPGRHLYRRCHWPHNLPAPPGQAPRWQD